MVLETDPHTTIEVSLDELNTLSREHRDQGKRITTLENTLAATHRAHTLAGTQKTMEKKVVGLYTNTLKSIEAKVDTYGKRAQMLCLTAATMDSTKAGHGYLLAELEKDLPHSKDVLAQILARMSDGVPSRSVLLGLYRGKTVMEVDAPGLSDIETDILTSYFDAYVQKKSKREECLEQLMDSTALFSSPYKMAPSRARRIGAFVDRHTTWVNGRVAAIYTVFAVASLAVIGAYKEELLELKSGMAPDIHERFRMYAKSHSDPQAYWDASFLERKQHTVSTSNSRVGNSLEVCAHKDAETFSQCLYLSVNEQGRRSTAKNHALRSCNLHVEDYERMRHSYFTDTDCDGKDLDDYDIPALTKEQHSSVNSVYTGFWQTLSFGRYTRTKNPAVVVNALREAKVALGVCTAEDESCVRIVQ